MKFLTIIILFVFCLCVKAYEEKEMDINDTEFTTNFINENGERVYIFIIGSVAYRENEQGELVKVLNHINVLGDQSLRAACLGGTSFDSSLATQDVEKEDLYYTIVNNTDSTVFVSTTKADKKGIFCPTPFSELENGECVKVYESDRLHTLTQVSVGDDILCGGWKDNKPFCKLGNSYEINKMTVQPRYLEKDIPKYSSGEYEMVVRPASNCE